MPTTTVPLIIPAANEQAVTPKGLLSRVWMQWASRLTSRAVLQGQGSPEGVVAAETGSLYCNLLGGAGTTLYVKQSSPTPSTGWIGK